MPLDAAVASEVKGLLAAAKSREINFGLCLGSKPEDAAFKLHRNTSPDALARAAKAEAKTTRVVCGTLTVSDGTLILKCDGNPPPGSAKQTKSLLKSMKLTFAVQFVDKDGLSIADADQAGPESPDAADGLTDDGPDPAAEWATLQARLDPLVAAYVKRGRVDPKLDASKVSAAWATAQEMASESDLAGALRVGRNVEQLLDQAPPEQAGGASPAAISEPKWQLASQQITPYVEAALKLRTGDADKIRAVWAFAQGKAEAKDFAGALKALGPLSQLLITARDASRTVGGVAEQWDQAASAFSMPDAITANPGARTQIEALWAYATEKAKHGKDTQTEADLAAALKALQKIKDLPVAASDAPKAGTAAAGQQAVEADQALRSAETRHAASAEAARAALLRLRTEFAPALPAELDLKAKALDALLAAAAETDPAKIGLAADKLDAAVAEIETLAGTLRKQRAAWVDDLSIFDVRMIGLDNHPLSANPTVKPLIDAIKSDLATAKLKADAGDWAGASLAVKPLLPRCDTTEQTADASAHCNAILNDRKQTLRALPSRTTVPQAQPKQALTAAHKLRIDAEAAMSQGKFADAVALLNQIPDAADRAAKLAAAAANYENSYTAYLGRVTTLKGYTGDAAAAIATGLAEFERGINEAKFDVTNDYLVSMARLGLVWKQHAGLVAKAKQAKDYTDALAAFTVRFTAVKDHPGRIAMEEFFKRLEKDRDFAATARTQGELATGAKVLNSGEGLQVEQIKLADACRDYKTRLKQAQDDIAAVESKPNAAKAAAETAEAKQRIAAAEAGKAKDWPGALKALEQVEAIIRTAEAALKADGDFEALKDDSKLNNVAGDFEAAFAVYQNISNHIAGRDTDNTFKDRLKKVGTLGTRARKYATGAKPDYAKATRDLNTAIAKCEEMSGLLVQREAAKAALVALKTEHTTSLPPLNADDCIKPALDRIGQAIKDADTACKGSVRDYSAAQTLIGAAQLEVRKTDVNGRAYAKMKPDREAIKVTLGKLKAPASLAGLTAEIQRLETALTAIGNDVAAEKMADAAKTAADTLKLCPGFEELATDYVKALGFRRNYLVARLPNVQGAGKEICKPEADTAVAKNAVIQTLLDEHVYKAVEAVATEGFWAIKAGEAILAAANLYEPSRDAAEKAITAARPNRNPATEERFDAIQESYDAAVAMAATRNFVRAKAATDPIPAACTALAADAQAYRDYADARTRAGQKLGEAAKSKQAEAIKPLLDHLRARHEAAVAIANKGDYGGAKTLLDELYADAEKALAAGAEYDTFATTSEGIKADTKPIADAVREAEALYQALMAKPEAMYAVAILGGINKVIEAAKKPGRPEADARKDLVKAVDACAKARLAMGQFTQMESEIAALEKVITDFLAAHPQANFIREAAEAVRTGLNGIKATARNAQKLDDASGKIAKADTDFIALKRAAEAQAVYVARKAVVEPDLATMEKHPSRYAIVTEITSFRKDLTDSAGKAAAYDHKAAMALLEKAAATAGAALLQAKMHANEEPTVAEIKKIIAGDKGAEKLDAIIATLDVQAKRKVLTAAFEARFGCKLDLFKTKADETAKVLDTATNAKDPNIRRFYDVMAELPETHTKDNDSMQVFVAVNETKGSDYTGGSTRKICMREGDARSSGTYGIALPEELEATEPGYETVPGDPITYFDWNTLHEVGHAVDDKLGFMKSKGSQLAGWEVYGGNVLAIAKIVATEYKFDAPYVASLMAGAGNVAVPEPDGCDGEEWERRRVACADWVGRARSDQQPWSTSAKAKAVAIGGICYHESQAGQWYSYPIAERQKGVTGYQFRAPGEWFSEMYAAYHTGKLKPTHPAASWLSGL